MSNYTLEQNQTTLSSKPQRSNPVIWGAVLLAMGGLLLLQNMGLLQGIAGFIWALAFAAGGLVFGSVYVGNTRNHWWAVIPAFALFGLAGTIMINEYAPGRMQFMAGAAFLGALGLAFWVIYFTRREFWWAMIPGGVLLSLSAVAAFEESGLFGGMDGGAVLFFGMGVTFLLVALSGRDEGNSRWWAYIPAGVMLVLGTGIFVPQIVRLMSNTLLWPFVLIAVGALLLLRAFTTNRNQ